MNKHGFLLAEETLKILIAVICLVFLVLLIVAVYNATAGTKKIKQAEDNLNRINEIINSLEEGKSETQDILNPKGWFLLSFIEEEKPNSCIGSNCLCICSEAILFKSQAEKCDKKGKGTCLNIANLESSNLEIKIKGTSDLTFISIKKQNDKILIGEV